MRDHELNGRLGLERLILVTEERFYFVYRLVLDAKPDRGMLWPVENARACSEDFQPATASMARKRHCIQRKGFLSVFVFSADTEIPLPNQ